MAVYCLFGKFLMCMLAFPCVPMTLIVGIALGSDGSIDRMSYG